MSLNGLKLSVRIHVAHLVCLGLRSSCFNVYVYRVYINCCTRVLGIVVLCIHRLKFLDSHFVMAVERKATFLWS